MMRLVKLPFKMLALLVILVLGTLGLIVRLTTNLSCYVVGPFMLFLGGSCVYSIVMQRWSQLAILSVMLLGCVIMLFGASWVLIFQENLVKIVIRFVYK